MMRKILMFVLMLAMVSALAVPALASGTGASPEEIALYSMTGPAGQGMPAFAKEKLGAEKGAQFVAAAAASSQAGTANIQVLVQALVNSGTPLKDAISLVLKSFYEKDGMYIYELEISYQIVSQAVAYIYDYSPDLYGGASSANRISTASGTGSWIMESLMPAEFWAPNYSTVVSLEKEYLGEQADLTADGNSLATAGPVAMPKPE